MLFPVYDLALNVDQLSVEVVVLGEPDGGV